jgi:DNA-binding CsgD family transcriptional regulator
MTVTIDLEPYADAESRIPRTALSVLERVRGDLVGTPFGVVVVDVQTRVIEPTDVHARPPAELHDAIARALPATQPFMETRGATTVALAPVSDPRSGRPAGVVALTCRAEAASELMVSYVRRVAREIEDGLVDDASAAERALTEHFVRVRRRARGAIVGLNERTMIVNAAAARFVDDADKSALWEWAQAALGGGQTKAQELSLSRGTAIARCEPVVVAGETVGALVRLDAGSHGPAAERPIRGANRTCRATFGWDSLSAAQLGIAELVAGGLTNGQVAARLYVSRHTVDFHLRQIFAKLSIESRVELARLVTERSVEQREAS